TLIKHKMTARQLTFVLLMTICLTSLGQTNLYFPNLTRNSIDTTYKVFFAYDKKFTRFINRPCYTLDRKDPLFCAIDSVLAEWTVVAKFKNEFLNDSLTIVYSEGMSADPGYVVTTDKGKLISRFS